MSTTTQYLKFENYDEFPDDLKSFGGIFKTIFEPTADSKEDYCYLEIDLKNIRDFLKHFSVQLTMVDSNVVDEWPSSLQSIKRKRFGLFTQINARPAKKNRPGKTAG